MVKVKGWFSDLKQIPILELETKLDYLLPALEMCKAYEISTNYRHKKIEHIEIDFSRTYDGLLN